MEEPWSGPHRGFISSIGKTEQRGQKTRSKRKHTSSIFIQGSKVNLRSHHASLMKGTITSVRGKGVRGLSAWNNSFIYINESLATEKMTPTVVISTPLPWKKRIKNKERVEAERGSGITQKTARCIDIGMMCAIHTGLNQITKKRTSSKQVYDVVLTSVKTLVSS